MRPAQTRTTPQASAVNVVCVDVSALIRAAREKEARERTLLNDRPVLGKSIDEILQEEVNCNTHRSLSPPLSTTPGVEGEENENAATTESAAHAADGRSSEEAGPKAAGTTTTPACHADGYLIKGCTRDAMVFPPLSPADPIILQEVLRNPEATLASGEQVVSRPSWAAREAPFSSLVPASQAERPVSSPSSASSTSPARRESFRVVPHTDERFRTQRRSYVDLDPYTTRSHNRHSSSGSTAKRTSVTQTFMDASQHRTSHTLTQLLYDEPSHPEVTRRSSDSDRRVAARRRSTQPLSSQLAHPVVTNATSVSASTVDCLTFNDPDTEENAAGARLSEAPDTIYASRLSTDGGNRAGGGAALAKLYLRSPGTAAAAAAATTTAAHNAVVVSDAVPQPPHHAHTAARVPARTSRRQLGTAASSWEPLPSVKPRSHVPAFQSTLVTAHTVQTNEEDWRHQQLRERQILSRPSARPSAPRTTPGTNTQHRVPVPFRHGAALAESQPKTRRPKRQ